MSVAVEALTGGKRCSYFIYALMTSPGTPHLHLSHPALTSPVSFSFHLIKKIFGSAHLLWSQIGFCQTLLLFSVWTCFNDTLFSLYAAGECSTFWHAPPSLNKSVHIFHSSVPCHLMTMKLFLKNTVILFYFIFIRKQFYLQFNCSCCLGHRLWSQLESHNPLLQ